MDDPRIAIRPARERDLPAVGRLGALLIRTHHAFDPARFMAAGPDPEGGYARFLGTRLAEDDVLVLVAERDEQVAGYLYAAIEPRSWMELREEAGFIHDDVVAEPFRRAGIASRLVDAAAEWCAGRGVRRVVLWTAERNEGAQRLFARLGFRRTMIEMTRELPPPAK